jgi:uncharacterized membrane protein HdeD (DUF308 family)
MSAGSPTWLRVADIALGVCSIIAALIVALNPSSGTRTIVSLLALSLIFGAVRLLMTGGDKQFAMALRGIGVVGGLVLVGILGFVVLNRDLALRTLVLLAAFAMTIQALENLSDSLQRGHPRWMRASSFTVGAVVLLAALAVLTPQIAIVSVVALLALDLVAMGLDSLISGIRPETKAQQTLVKLVLFALAYGLLFVNWIDLYNVPVPAYHIWVAIAYLMPFGVLLVIRGSQDWELAFSLGLLASLGNDLGYYVVGDAFFGFHVGLVDWYAHQFGLYGNTVLFTFNGGFFSFPVLSWMMGLWIYARIVVVALTLKHWWNSHL